METSASAGPEIGNQVRISSVSSGFRCGRRKLSPVSVSLFGWPGQLRPGSNGNRPFKTPLWHKSQERKTASLLCSRHGLAGGATWSRTIPCSLLALRLRSNRAGGPVNSGPFHQSDLYCWQCPIARPLGGRGRFWRPYKPGESTDIGTAFPYIILFLLLLVVSAGRYYGIDYWLTPRLGIFNWLASGPFRRRQ